MSFAAHFSREMAPLLDRVNDYRYNSTGNPWRALPWEARARMKLYDSK